jgi:TonB family protein
MHRLIALIVILISPSVLAGPEKSPETLVDEFADAIFSEMTAIQIPCDEELADRSSGAGVGVICARAFLNFEGFLNEWNRSLEQRAGAFDLVPVFPWKKTADSHMGVYTLEDIPVAIMFSDLDGIVVVTYPGTTMWEVGERSVLALFEAVARSEKTTPAERGEVESTQDGPPYVAGVGSVSNPRLIQSSKVPPSYPEQAREELLEASVIMQAIVREDGTIGDLEILECTRLGMGFEDAAIEAVRQWRYEPALLDDQPVDVYFTVVVSFRLQ